jgi:short-subunit dehydrogenase
MQYAIVTGATQGIGKAIAEKLLSEGFSVAVCSRNSDKLQILEKIWSAQYPNATVFYHKADLGNKEEVLLFAQTVLNKFPQIDVLVNNAGLFLPGNLADEADGHLEMLMSVNLYSAYHLTRCILPSMKKSMAGHIFNMCSVASLKSYPQGGSYGITKYALHGFSENLREELRFFNIKVTSIFPGATDTPSWEGSGIAKDRMMESGDVANMLWASYSLSKQADVESIILRPVMGDI